MRRQIKNAIELPVGFAMVAIVGIVAVGWWLTLSSQDRAFIIKEIETFRV